MDSVEFEFVVDFHCLLVLPHLSVQCAQCEDKACKEQHFLVLLGWLFCRLEIYID